METKTIQWIECERCGASVDSGHAKHLEDDWSLTEMDLCNACYEIVVGELEAKFEV